MDTAEHEGDRADGGRERTDRGGFVVRASEGQIAKNWQRALALVHVKMSSVRGLW